MKQIKIFDTTLRDGEQSANATLTRQEKLQIARQLMKLGVDVIEAGFPISSQGDFEAVREIAKLSSDNDIIITGLSRAMKEDIERCYEAVKYAKKPRIHTFIAASDVHIEYKFKKTRQEVLKMAVDAVGYAKSLLEGKGEVEFSPEDATRADFDYLCTMVRDTINAGADVINIPDTVGYSSPLEFRNLILGLKKNVPELERVILSVHCHNDLGLAVANSLSVVDLIQQIECTVNGIGERSGNASLEEIAASLSTRKDFYNIYTGINLKEIGKTSKLVSRLTGLQVSANKPIVGANAFSHSAGIHQDGISKRRETYEIMKPDDFGWSGSNIVIGARSGSGGIRKKLEELGFSVSDSELEEVVKLVKTLADKKKEIFDEDLIVIAESLMKIPETYKLEYLEVKSGTVKPEAIVRIKFENKIFEQVESGDGPVDSSYNAIQKITSISAKLDDYSLKSISSGTDAQGEVTVKLSANGNSVIGRGVSTDITEASALAYINALNKLVYKEKNSNNHH
ncbi:2-isopropylmalate synthase [Candidatus Pacearchaeota archaeon]|nr:2-isopropylmalate synthase [Candidatus Pacearchaeota archaeon]